jgi:predicted AlkP superfamily pyrophosphatase or phosphodiesterase
MPNQVFQAESLGVAVPNLQLLVKEGSFATGVRTVVPSLTYPAHTTILTGVSPAVHGIASNITFDPTGANKEGWDWYAKDIRVSTLWDIASNAGLVTANICWPVSVGAHIDYNLVQYWRAALPDDAKLYKELSTPQLVDELTSKAGPIPYGADFSPEADEMRTKFAEYVLIKKHPSFMTVYLGSLDAVEHRVGPSGPEALRVLERIDLLVGRLRTAFELTTSKHRIIAIVSDHGFIKYHTEIELGSLLRERHFIDLGTDDAVTSWRAGAWTAGGTGAIVINPVANAEVRASIESLVNEMRDAPEYGVKAIFTGHEISQLQGFIGVDYVIALQPGFKWGRNLLGPIFIRREGGTHGYLPDESGMDAAFFIAGQRVPEFHSLGRIDMRDIAPTLAGRISLPMPQAEGKNLFAP